MAKIIATWKDVKKFATIAHDYAYGQDVAKAFVDHSKISNFARGSLYMIGASVARNTTTTLGRTSIGSFGGGDGRLPQASPCLAASASQFCSPSRASITLSLWPIGCMSCKKARYAIPGLPGNCVKMLNRAIGASRRVGAAKLKFSGRSG